jgi:hypothetical protein
MLPEVAGLWGNVAGIAAESGGPPHPVVVAATLAGRAAIESPMIMPPASVWLRCPQR